MSATKQNAHAGKGGSLRRRRRPSADDEADEYSQLLNSPTPRAKRMRPSIESGNIENLEADEAADDTFHSAIDGGVAETDAQDGNSSSPVFQPGAIVKVFVENFVTYERAEFDPGPSLNMVIGPNGTGKSSLVCAICLGLGFHSNVLGRASAFGDFVKHGRSHAIVEIELQKRPKDRQNFVVRLRITREDNSRKFWLNGQETSLRKIQSVMQDLRIQVDNLCQFLPQDRVAEFAGLNSVDLLAKTLEAAAPTEMKEWQSTLKRIYQEQKEAQHRMKVDAEQLRVLESRHQAQQADVERYREREEVQRMVDNLEACRPLVRFYEAKKKYHKLKALKHAATKELKVLQERVGPTLEAVNDKEVYQQRLAEALDTRKAAVRHSEQTVARAMEDIERVEEQRKEVIEQRKALKDSLDKKKKEIAATRQKITNLEAKHKNKPQEFVAAEWNMKIREKEHLRREVEAERREILADRERIKGQAEQFSAERQEVERNISVLDSKRGQQFSLLKRIAPEVAQGWQWLEQNKSQFSQEIFGPPMVTCSVKDKQYSNLVQSLLQNDDFLCFTAQNVQDHKKLSDQFYDVMGLSVTIRTCTTAFAQFRSPLTPEELSTLGLDGVAVDFLEGPEPVLSMLCTERRLHCSPVCLEKPRQDQYDMLVTNEKISTWAAKDQFYRVNRRREYGAHAVSTVVRDIRPGRYWTEGQADMSEKTGLEQQLDELNRKLQGLRQEFSAVNASAAGPAERMAEIDTDLDRLRDEKNQLQMEYSKWTALPEKIQVENNVLSRIQEEHSRIRGQQLEVIGKLDELVLQKARTVLRHAEKLSALRDACYGVVDAQVRLIEAKSDVEGLKTKHADIADILVTKQDAVRVLQENMRVQKTEGEQALEAAQNVAEEGSEWSEMLHELARNKTLEDLDNEVAAEKAKLDLTRVVDASVLEAFRKRGREMEQLKVAMSTQEQKYGDMSEQIAEVRGKWEPRLDELIGRINDAFSYNFEQINCAGEVSVHKDDDFDKWAIEIRVKFRENEELQKLDQHRQSGGERAVSTIFYLMSLQGMAQAPFRVVDEINQGMDPRNERMMHERMVDVACHEHASQYFLITPKLLPGLRYDENMTVLCIASGQHVPSGEAKLDLRRCMQIQQRLVAAA
ncbi:structural maintenance of chromosome complex subunit [Grosmannia clavigera kw1407]|uniref:Structural maintenance of chromosomes protein 5 n=1 Tax=Grosmannia clavigera (strain kw1407 / UAMH 11150) TaxID=655863 RepID=F0XTC0_GROCL|nr:structural maintenance of chromosome complex subunit [Grosmannia clavigera kw1407]EFW99146.1 structural maintenance of chromosome complex subunit [Grosmannia clavigera kw1407]